MKKRKIILEHGVNSSNLFLELKGCSCDYCQEWKPKLKNGLMAGYYPFLRENSPSKIRSFMDKNGETVLGVSVSVAFIVFLSSGYFLFLNSFSVNVTLASILFVAIGSIVLLFWKNWLTHVNQQLAIVELNDEEREIWSKALGVRNYVRSEIGDDASSVLDSKIVELYGDVLRLHEFNEKNKNVALHSVYELRNSLLARAQATTVLIQSIAEKLLAESDKSFSLNALTVGAPVLNEYFPVDDFHMENKLVNEGDLR